MRGLITLVALFALGALPLWGPPDGIPPTAASLPMGQEVLRPHEARLFWAVLEASQETAGSDSQAGGWALFNLEDDGTISYRIRTWGMEGTAGHIHSAAWGDDGATVFPLTGGGDAWKGTTGKADHGVLGRLRSGRLMVNIHSENYPAGEIRGQILPMPILFGGSLEGEGSGYGLFWLESDGSLSYRVETSGIQPSGGSVRSESGVLFEFTGGPEFWGRTDPLTQDDVRALLTCGLEAVVTSDDGEMGGTLRTLPNLFVARLDGKGHSPTVATAATAAGSFLLQPNGDLAYLLVPEGLEVTAAHLHVGKSGRSGPPVFPLDLEIDGYRGVGPLDRGTIHALLRGGVYANVHTTAHPGGEIRGTLYPALLPFGDGCAPVAGLP